MRKEHGKTQSIYTYFFANVTHLETIVVHNYLGGTLCAVHPSFILETRRAPFHHPPSTIHHPPLVDANHPIG